MDGICRNCFCALAFIVAFLLWFVFGRDDQVVETVEFYPPDGLNSVELAFAYRGYVSSKDVVSMLLFGTKRLY